MRYIYLHGFASGRGSTKGRYFRRKFQEIGKDLELTDLTENDFEHTTLSRQLSLVKHLLKGCTEDVCMIGSSLGGWLAALLAEDIQQVCRLVLLAPAFGFVGRQSQILGPARLKEWKQRGVLPVYHYGTRRTQQLHYAFYEDALKHEQRVVRRRLPALVFHGIFDESVPYSLSVEYLKRNPQARVVLLAADHSLIDQLEGIWDMMVAFLHLP